MKLATRINSYLRIEGYDLEKSFSDFKKVGLGYVDSRSRDGKWYGRV